MKMISKKDKRIIWLILGILILAFCSRIWGIGYGLPYFFIGDEQALVGGALKMAELRTLLPVFYPDEFRLMYYPPLIPYLYLIFFAPLILIKFLIGSFGSLIELKNSLILDSSSLWLTARLISVLIGTVTIYLVYLIGKKIFNQWIGLVSALFLTFSFLHLQLSHFARHWAPAIFFTYLVIFLAFLFYKNPQKKYYLWTGLIAGLAFGVSYFTAISLLLVLFIHFLPKGSSFFQKLKDKNLWLMMVIFIVVAFIFVFLHPQEFFRILVGEDSGLVQSKNLAGLLSSFGYYFQVLLLYEPILLFLSLIGWLILWIRSKRYGLIFLFWPFIYIAVFYSFFHHEPRYIVFIIPWLALLAGYALYSISKRLTSIIPKKLAVVLILLLVFGYPLAVTIKYDSLLVKKDTRLLAEQWIKNNIPAGSRIITDWSGIKLTATKESILNQQNIDENSLRTDDRILLSLAGQNYPQPAYYLLRLHFIGDKFSNDLSQYLRENNYQYFIFQCWDKEKLTEQEKSIIKEGRLLKRFDSGLGDYSVDINGVFLKPVSLIFSLERFGPIIEIYQL